MKRTASINEILATWKNRYLRKRLAELYVLECSEIFDAPFGESPFDVQIPRERNLQIAEIVNKEYDSLYYDSLFGEL